MKCLIFIHICPRIRQKSVCFYIVQPHLYVAKPDLYAAKPDLYAAKPDL